jgi:hypothetical protein
MRRALLLSLLLLAASPAAAQAASVKLLACVPALDGPERSATFEARVRPLRGSDRIQVRFTLQVREAALETWRRVAAPGLDEWLTSAPGVSRYSYSKTVQNLAAPATYRMVVRFRWLDAGGAVVARSRATSRGCRQPDMRPDLEVAGIVVTAPLEPGPARYAVELVNAGRSPAAAFTVTLSAGGEQLDPVAVAGLAPGERRVLELAGPRCAPGTTLTATADPELAVDERDEDDNVLVAACPP